MASPFYKFQDEMRLNVEARDEREGAMPGRPHKERLMIELGTIRKELIEEAGAVPPEELDWMPRPDMKSYRNLLLEIGTTEMFSLHFLRDGILGDWDEDWQSIERGGNASGLLLSALESVRAETLDYLATCDEQRLQTPVLLPEEWRPSFGGIEEIEPEELFREIARHEYYHLGQIITYRWIQGHNPYKQK
jgi:hypothetical protein